MRKKNKLDKFEDNILSHNVIQEGKELFNSIKGRWSEFFENDNDLVVELACGRGEYTTALAQRFPEKNFIGVDIKGDRIWFGSQFAQLHQMSNVAFLRTQISYLRDFFAENEVAEIWITFPDPRPKDRDEKHRLTNPFYLKMYSQMLREDGWMKLKTDSNQLFEYSINTIENFGVTNLNITSDLYHSDFAEEHFGIKTKYEKIWTDKGKTIKYLKFKFVD